MMSDIIDKLVEGAGQVISDVDAGGTIQSAISGIRQRMADADRRRRINQVKQQILDLRAQESQAINALSAQVLALHEAGSLTQPELVSLCKNVDEIREQIEEQEVELEQLQPPAPVPAAQPAPAEQPQPQAPVAETVCPSCGVAVVAGAAFCQTCGERLVEEKPSAPVLFCVHCGAQLREGARFCPKCGQTVPEG
jgi:RNA polymerase subunit RPABC4/transcription elongation factor Spt4